MAQHGYKPGHDVLLRATVTDDGHCVRVAPGVEILLSPGVQVATDVPEGCTFPIMFFFATDADRQDFARQFSDTPDVDQRIPAL